MLLSLEISPACYVCNTGKNRQDCLRCSDYVPYDVVCLCVQGAFISCQAVVFGAV